MKITKEDIQDIENDRVDFIVHELERQCEPSIAGSNGRRKMFYAAQKVKEIAGRHNSELAFRALCQYDQKTSIPPWSARAKTFDCRSQGELARDVAALITMIDWEPVGVRTKEGPKALARVLSKEEATEKAKKRARWEYSTEYARLTEKSKASLVRYIAEGRVSKERPDPLPFEAIERVCLAGLVHCKLVDNHNLSNEERFRYIITNGEFAQERRVDGGLIPVKTKDQNGNWIEGRAKCKTLPGSVGNWVGIPLLPEPGGTVLLVEGCVGLFEAAAAIELQPEHSHGWGMIAAVSCYSKFTEDLIDRLKGGKNTVVIAPDSGEAGSDAAIRWENALKHFGVPVKVWRPSAPYVDLGSIVGNKERHWELQSLFAI